MFQYQYLFCNSISGQRRQLYIKDVSFLSVELETYFTGLIELYYIKHRDI